MKRISFLLLLPLLFSCINGDIDFKTRTDDGINIYLVQDSMVRYVNETFDLNTLTTEPVPWLKNSEIEFYDWSAHIFSLNTTKEKGKYSGRHFIVKTEKKIFFSRNHYFLESSSPCIGLPFRNSHQ